MSDAGAVFLRKDDVLWVSRVDENAFGVPHILQIIHTQGKYLFKRSIILQFSELH